MYICTWLNAPLIDSKVSSAIKSQEFSVKKNKIFFPFQGSWGDPYREAKTTFKSFFSVRTSKIPVPPPPSENLVVQNHFYFYNFL